MTFANHAHVRRWRDTGAIAQFVVEWNGLPVKSVKNAWAQAVRLAGIEGNPTPHKLRHTCVTWLKQAGESSSDVAGFTGMSEAMVDRVYGKHDPNYQRGVANPFRALPTGRIVGRSIGPADKRKRQGGAKPL